MALVPRMGSTPVVPTAVPFSGGAAVAGTTAVSQVEGIQAPRSGTDTGGFYYESFDMERDHSDAPYVAPRRRDRRVVSNLLLGTAQSFADAFAMVERGSTTNSGNEQKSLAFFRVGSEVYISNMHVVNDDLPKRGSEVSFML